MVDTPAHQRPAIARSSPGTLTTAGAKADAYALMYLRVRTVSRRSETRRRASAGR